MVFFKVGIVGNNCIVIAAENVVENQNTICSLDGKITVAWSGKHNKSKYNNKFKITPIRYKKVLEVETSVS